jgi:metal-responsive CopG/Arc/MetJ family transcriptional regulator
MSAISKLYSINNKTMKKTINIEDTLYDRLMKFVKKNYDATFSEVINVCIEEYIEKNKPSFYEKPQLETVTYRSIMIRKENLKDLQKMYKKTGISVTRLLNGAVKEFLEKYDNKR